MSFMLPLIAAFILLGGVLHGLSYMMGRDGKAKMKMYDYVLGSVYCFILFLIIGHGVSSLSSNLEQEIAPVIVALEEYKKDMGQYPESSDLHADLQSLVPTYLSILPGCTGGRSSVLHYRHEGGNYDLFCYNGPGISKYQYSSDSKKWQQIWD